MLREKELVHAEWRKWNFEKKFRELEKNRADVEKQYRLISAAVRIAATPGMIDAEQDLLTSLLHIVHQKEIVVLAEEKASAGM